MKIIDSFLLAILIIVILWCVYVTIGFINDVIWEGMLEPWIKLNLFLL